MRKHNIFARGFIALMGGKQSESPTSAMRSFFFFLLWGENYGKDAEGKLLPIDRKVPLAHEDRIIPLKKDESEDQKKDRSFTNYVRDLTHQAEGQIVIMIGIARVVMMLIVAMFVIKYMPMEMLEQLGMLLFIPVVAGLYVLTGIGSQGGQNQ